MNYKTMSDDSKYQMIIYLIEGIYSSKHFEVSAWHLKYYYETNMLVIKVVVKN